VLDRCSFSLVPLDTNGRKTAQAEDRVEKGIVIQEDRIYEQERRTPCDAGQAEEARWNAVAKSRAGGIVVVYTLKRLFVALFAFKNYIRSI
jgi:hypothetical protein